VTATAPWQVRARQDTTAYVVARDMTITWDNSEVRVAAGTVVHAVPGSQLWAAYGGAGGLRPVHGGPRPGRDG
jgi:hypothetical protein